MKSRFMMLTLLLFFLIPALVSADIGPKPAADFHVTWEGQEVQDRSFHAKMLSCQQEGNRLPGENVISLLNISEYDPEKDCIWMPSPLAWGGTCENAECHFNYFLPIEFKLAVYLPSQDKVFISPEVTRENFRSTYDVELLPDGSIDLKETTPFMESDASKNIRDFITALVITLILELLAARIFFSAKRSKKALLSVIAANAISLPLVWFVFPLLKNMLLVIILAEIFAFVFEAYVIHFLNKELISLKRSFLLSLIMNAASFFLGGFILLVIMSGFF
ncbi:MAG: hypothetical protein ABIH34_07535 [Nanoarchaeota archaeon]